MVRIECVIDRRVNCVTAYKPDLRPVQWAAAFRVSGQDIFSAFDEFIRSVDVRFNLRHLGDESIIVNNRSEFTLLH